MLHRNCASLSPEKIHHSVSSAKEVPNQIRFSEKLMSMLLSVPVNGEGDKSLKEFSRSTEVAMPHGLQ